MARIKTRQSIPMKPTMYRVVFDGVLVKYGVFLLFVFLLLQPLAPAFADEIVSNPPSDTVVDTESISAPPEEITEEASEEPEAQSAEEPEETEMIEQQPAEEAAGEPPVVPAGGNEEENNDTASSTEEEIHTPEQEATSTDDVVTDPQPSDQQEADAQESGVGGENEANDNMNEESADMSDEDEIDASNEQATATQSASTTDESVLIVDHNANQLQFDPAQCASVGDGAFYCSTPKSSQEFKEDGVFAAPDSDGDMEIFVRLNGEETQVTSNLIDDNAPYYDALSDRIVWHANYNDRYQIMSYDMRTNEEVRLTSTPYNNMEPVAYGDITMYQSWIDNNWEIMYHDGTELRRLTTNTQHDVSPSIRGGYIVWQSQFSDGWQVAVYDQKTDHVEYVKSDGGAKVENPRFVLVYDSTNNEGDVQTLGYDFDNRQAFTLNSIPADLPDELPDPDQTGETRALIQSKQSVRGTEIQEDDIVPTNTATSTPTTTASSDIPPVDLTVSDTPAASTSAQTTAPIEELIVPSFDAATTTTEISHIPDVFIPPLQSTSSAEVR